MFRKAVRGRNRGGGGLWKKRRERGDTEHRRGKWQPSAPAQGHDPRPGVTASPAIAPPAQDSGRGFSGSDHARGSSRNLGGHPRAWGTFPTAVFLQLPLSTGTQEAGFPRVQGTATMGRMGKPGPARSGSQIPTLCPPGHGALLFSQGSGKGWTLSPLACLLPPKKFAPKTQTI